MTHEKKPTPFFEVGEKQYTPEEADREMERFFGQLEEELKEVPEVVIQEGAHKLVEFLKGNITWAEILNLTPETMQRIAEFGYMQLQAGRLEDAERFFKVLTMLNWYNPYFHSMLGLVYQRQDRAGEAIAQYSEAIKLNPKDGVSLVNRASLFIRYGWFPDAEHDLEQALLIGDAATEEWGKTAKVLQGRMSQLKAQRVHAKDRPAPKPGKKVQ